MKTKVISLVTLMFSLLSGWAADLDPRWIGSWPGFERPTIAWDVAVSGNRVCLLGSGQFWVIDLNDPTAPRTLGACEYDRGFCPFGWCMVRVAVAGNTVCVANGSPDLQVLDIGDPAKPRLVATCDTGSFTLDVTLSGGYAYVATVGGMKVIDLADPAKPRLVGGYATRGALATLALSGRYVLAAENPHWDDTAQAEIGCGLLVLDVNDPERPQPLASYEWDVSVSDLVVSGNHAFVAGGWEVGANSVSGLRVVDLSDPSKPQPVGAFAIRGDVTHVAVAGNFAYLATRDRQLVALDIANPANPKEVGRCRIGGSLTGVAVSGNHVCLASLGRYYERDRDLDGGLRVVDVRNPATPVLVGRAGGGFAENVVVSGPYAYLADGEAGLKILRIVDPAKPQLVGSLITRGYAEDVVVSGQYAYLAVGTNGLEVIDVRDPERPQRAGGWDTSGDAQDIVVSGQHAYVANGEPGLQIIDFTDPAHPIPVGGYDTPGSAVGVAIAGAHAYVTYEWKAGITQSAQYGMAVIDVSNPSQPRQLGGFTGYFSFRDVALAGDYAYVIGDGHLQVIDIRRPASPTRVGYYFGDDYGSERVAVSGNNAYLTGGSLKIIDISAPASPRRVSGHYLGCSGVAISGHHAFLANGPAGLHVIDLSRKANPQRIGRIGDDGSIVNTVATSGTQALVGGYLLPKGWSFHMVDIRNPVAPQIVGGYSADWINSVAAGGRYAYAAESPGWDGARRTRTGGLRVIDLANPASPRPVRLVATAGNPVRVAVAGTRAYLLDADWNPKHPPFEGEGLIVFDLSDPANPQRLGTYLTTNANALTVSGHYAYVLDEGAGGRRNLLVIDVNQANRPQRVGFLGTGGQAQDIAVCGQYAYVANGRTGLEIIDVSNPTSPKQIATCSTGYSAASVAVWGRFAYVATSGGLQVIDIAEPASPRWVGGNAAFTAKGVVVADRRVFVATDGQGLAILDLFGPAFERVFCGAQGEMRLQMGGPWGTTGRLQRSTDLKDWTDWQSVTFPLDPVEISDPDTTSVSQRFYRLVLP